ncbi:hypothetical protein MASR2M15_23990 [Anaerolineales bacterium]
MRIIMFSMTPLYAHQSMGGAQKQLKKVAIYLGELGHDVQILCTERADVNSPFYWHPNVKIEPIFRFKQPFPEPYATDIYNLSNMVQILGDYLKGADRFYNHDGGMIFPYVYQDIPTVVSLRSVLFAETLQSGFLFQGDALILPSQHSRQVWLGTAGRFFPNLDERIKVIVNGLDWEQYQRQDASALAARLGLDCEQYQYILYPHRPDDEKGIRQTITVMQKLRYEYGLERVKVLVPRWIDHQLASHVQAYYRSLTDEIAEKGLQDCFIFHDWISDNEMPLYYSLGSLTLALGRYVETFGNTVPESLACGTPVIAAKVGPYRDLYPDELVYKVDYGDVEQAAAYANEILNKRQVIDETQIDFLKANFSQVDMVEAYADIILNVKKQTPLVYVHQSMDSYDTFQLAAWCYISERGVYHDFRAEYRSEPAALVDMLSQEGRIDFQRAEEKGISKADILDWYRDGYLILDI